MFNFHRTTRQSFLPSRNVFHHDVFGSHPETAREHADKNPKGQNPEAEAGQLEQRFETKETQENQYLASASFFQDPRKMERWRFLSPVMKVAYFALPESGRKAYLDKHNEYLEASYQASLRLYENLPQASKVPKVQPSLRTPELAVRGEIYALGGRIVDGVSKNFPAKVQHFPGSGDPESALQVFESTVAKLPADKLQGATILLAFDEELFRSDKSEESYTQATNKLLEAIKKAGMVAVFAEPLKIGRNRYDNIQQQMGETQAAQRRQRYLDFVSKCYQEGLVGSMVGLGAALISRNTMGIHEKYLNDPNDPSKGLNEEGMKYSVNGFIAGINIAHGHRTLDDQLLPVERTSSDPEIYYHGQGKKVEGAKGTAELVPGFPSVADIKDPELKHNLERIGQLPFYLEVLGVSYTYADIEKMISDTQALIQKAKEKGEDTRVAELELQRQTAEVYFTYAYKALQEAKKGPTGPRIDAARRAIEEAKKKDAQYGFTDTFRKNLKKVEEALEMLGGGK